MRDSIVYSALRSLIVAFCTMIGIGLGLFFLLILIGVLSSSSSADSKLTTVNTQEILPNAAGKREVLSKDAPVILQINIDGIIGTESLNAKTVRQQLVESREGDFKNNRVKAILLYIDTPGGTVNDADGIYRALKEYKELYQVPIYAYVNGLCASGGMYVAAAADKVFASDTSLIGSVGVIAPTFMNVTKLLDKLGVEALTISAGKDKDAMNPLRPWKPNEDQNYRQIIDYYYQYFVDIVALARPNMNKEKLIQEYGANIFPAVEAHAKGYIDQANSSLKEALKELLKKAEIEGDYYQLIKLENKQWWSSLFSSESSMLHGKIKHQLVLPAEFDPALCNQFLYLYRP